MIEFTIRVDSWSSFWRVRINESISSINIIAGWSFLAKENTAAVRFWDSPYHLSNREVTWNEKD